MRHRKHRHKLSRTTGHRNALLRNLAAALIQHERIRTTEAKAKALRPYIEKLVTLGKKGETHHYRQAFSKLQSKEAVKKLFTEVAPRFAERPGGYTRIIHDLRRAGDGAVMAYIEFVDAEVAVAAAPAAKEESETSDS
ncbi:MAG: 50S ribosomal protein L17 [Sumerlaeia bacterium]